MRDVVVAGVGMTAFGRFLDRNLKSLSAEAVAAALADAGLTAAAVEAIYFGNAAAGTITGQHNIRGQSALRPTGLLGKPIVNIENACASGSSAVQSAWLAVASGQYDVALAVGAEKLVHPDKSVVFRAMESGLDLDRVDEMKAAFASAGAGATQSIFMDIYARMARDCMARSGATAADFARIAVKNYHAGALNPKAQFRDEVTEAQVLQSRMISDPITLLMCSAIGDGAAAVILCSRKVADRLASPPVSLRACVLASGSDDAEAPKAATRAARKAFELAGIGPEDIDVVELHDAAAPGEMVLYEELELCGRGGGPALLASGATALGGRMPVNPSGGLLSKGHPVGATGCAQIVELTEQLRGRAGARQVAGARVALAENGGGYLGHDTAACVVTLLSA